MSMLVNVTVACDWWCATVACVWITSCWQKVLPLDSSREYLPFYTILGGCCWLERDRKVAVFDRWNSDFLGPLIVVIVLGIKMPPRRRGRGRGQFEESAVSARSHTRVSNEEEDEIAAPLAERMDVVIARFQRMNPPVFNADRGPTSGSSQSSQSAHQPQQQ
ncbi:hypothetical protein F511_38381 [Dorcoceras hygrometricum]|uniref:Uncharacterized protein n=1 Tax=Dorcoceras hygrometricum TaxID=472368 RepID=A0A2Z7D398_9LAMI|nr:hypothetical protein F511_38381 [Dorcoceras hygrometricum]